MPDPRPKTYLVDIDGTLLRHPGSMAAIVTEFRKELLPGVKEKFQEWERTGATIVLLTGRKESLRVKTEAELRTLGLFWDHLLMGLGGGVRVLINDLKADSSEPTAIAINVLRNLGLHEADA